MSKEVLPLPTLNINSGEVSSLKVLTEIIGIATNKPIVPLHVVGSCLSVIHSNDSIGTRWSCYKTRGTEALPESVESGDTIGIFDTGGFGDTPQGGPKIEMITTENWSGAASGSQMRFSTIGNSTKTGSVALTLEQDQSATFTGIVVYKSYTVATLPSQVAGGMIFVTDENEGTTTAFSDGTNWRRSHDRVVVS
jgi:hypothetical protein